MASEQQHFFVKMSIVYLNRVFSGCKIPPDNRVHYNFPLNLETNDSKCHGVDGLLDAYRAALARVQLAGPSDFAPCVRLAARYAASLPQDGANYNVLLILTDGVIADIKATKEEIVKVSRRSQT